jgi:LytS/YehU family sensor histidine kinase
MLLIPSVENAFKHTAGSVEEHGFIKIDLSVKENKLHFSVMNKFTSGNQGEMDKASGIGLSNVRKRLQLIYPLTHVLDIERMEDVFAVALTVELETTIDYQ